MSTAARLGSQGQLREFRSSALIFTEELSAIPLPSSQPLVFPLLFTLYFVNSFAMKLPEQPNPSSSGFQNSLFCWFSSHLHFPHWHLFCCLLPVIPQNYNPHTFVPALALYPVSPSLHSVVVWVSLHLRIFKISTCTPLGVSFISPTLCNSVFQHLQYSAPGFKIKRT